MNIAIEQLEQEKNESGMKYREEGRKSGIEWAKSAHYREMKKVVVKKGDIDNFYGQYDAISYSHIAISEDIREYIACVFAQDPLLDEVIDGAGLVLGSCLSEEASEWFLGWLEGVEEIWNTGESKLQR